VGSFASDLKTWRVSQNPCNLVKPHSGNFDRFPDFHESIDSTNQQISPEI
jgi:hypothetical protein